VLDKVHTCFRHLWKWNGNETEIASRSIDDTGYTQPTLSALINARGKDMGGYHLNPITSWRVKRGGSVLLKPEKWK